MGQIEKMRAVDHDQLPGVLVFPMTSDLNAGTPQEVLVQVEPGVEIPLHRHSVDATMFIVGGSGTVLADDPVIAMRPVERGDVVYFERNAAHGFRAGDAGLIFVSRNGGIVAEEAAGWDIEFC